MPPRYFRGTIACGLQDYYPKHNKYNLSLASARRLATAINNGTRPVPMRFEHTKSNDVGKVLSAHIDANRNLVCDFEINDDLAASMIDVKQWRGLSLLHEEDYHELTGQPLGHERPGEVSLCIGQSGMRPGTCILHELEMTTNGLEHKAVPTARRTIQASALHSSSSSSSSPMSTNTFVGIRDPSSAASYSNQSELDRGFAFPGKASSSSSSSSQPMESTPSQPSGPKNYAFATQEDLVKDIAEPLMRSNLSEGSKRNVMEAFASLVQQSRAVPEYEKKVKDLESQHSVIQEEKNRMVNTFTNALTKILQMPKDEEEIASDDNGGEPEQPGQMENEIQRLRSSGALDQLATSQIGRRLVAASSFMSKQRERQSRKAQQEEEERRRKEQEEKEEQERQGMDKGSFDAFKKLTEMSKGAHSKGQLPGGYCLPLHSIPSSSSSSTASATIKAENGVLTQEIAASNFGSKNKRSLESETSSEWHFAPVIDNLFKKFTSTDTGVQQLTDMMGRRHDYANRLSHESAKQPRLGEYDYRPNTHF